MLKLQINNNCIYAIKVIKIQSSLNHTILEHNIQLALEKLSAKVTVHHLILLPQLAQ